MKNLSIKLLLFTFFIITVNEVLWSKSTQEDPPRYVLEVKQTTDFYGVQARKLDPSSNGKQEAIRYKWGLKSARQPLSWTISDKAELAIKHPSEGETLTVYLKIIDSTGKESRPLFIRIAGNEIFDIGFKRLILNSKGEMYTEQGEYLYYEGAQMPLLFRMDIQLSLKPRWSPMSAIVINEKGNKRTITWYRNGYIKDILPPSEIAEILKKKNNEETIYHLLLLDFDNEVIQRFPFTVIYKENFPE